jgi:acyl carrier protein
VSIEERVFKIVAQACRTDATKIGRETEYVKDLNITKSVAYYQLSAMVEAEFNIKADFIKIKNSGTVGATVDYIKSLVSE